MRMDFSSIWLIWKLKIVIFEYIRNSNIKLNEYAKFEYLKNPYSLDALLALCKSHLHRPPHIESLLSLLFGKTVISERRSRFIKIEEWRGKSGSGGV